MIARPATQPDPAWSEVEDCPVCETHPYVGFVTDKPVRFVIRCCDAMVPRTTGASPSQVVRRWNRRVTEARALMDRADMARFGRLMFDVLRGHTARMGQDGELAHLDLCDPEAEATVRAALSDVAHDLGLCPRCLGVSDGCMDCAEPPPLPTEAEAMADRS